MFFSLAPSSTSRRCRRIEPWVAGFPFGFPMEVQVDVDSDNQEREAVRQEEARQLQALNELMTNPLRFISAQVEKAKQAQKQDQAAIKKTHFDVKLNVDGYKPEELDVKLVDNCLTISGKHEHKDESGFVSKNFTRSWNIPENVQLEQLSCNLNSKDQTLMISAPYKELPLSIQEKVIPINVTGLGEDLSTKEVEIDGGQKTAGSTAMESETSEVAKDGTLEEPSVGA